MARYKVETKQCNNNNIFDIVIGYLMSTRFFSWMHKNTLYLICNANDFEKKKEKKYCM